MNTKSCADYTYAYWYTEDDGLANPVWGMEAFPACSLDDAKKTFVQRMRDFDIDAFREGVDVSERKLRHPEVPGSVGFEFRQKNSGDMFAYVIAHFINASDDNRS